MKAGRIGKWSAQAVLVAWSVFASVAAQAEVRYKVVDLGVELFQTLPEAVPSISSTGLVAGTDTFPAARAYVWRDGQASLIQPSIDNAFTVGYDVNASGAVVGVTPGSGYNGTFPRPFIYENGTLSYIPDLKANTPSVNARAAYAINDAGVVVGEWETQAFIYANGVSTALSASTNASGNVALNTVARDINNKGWAVGSASYMGADGAVIWHDGVAVDIGTLPLDPFWRPDATAMAINDQNEVVGYSRTSLANGGNARHAFFWRNGQWTDLGTLRGPEWNSVAYGVNDQGLVVGSADCPYRGCAFVWRNTEGMLQLQNYIDPAGGWLLDKATDINDAGWIVGNGTLNGQPRDFLLIPVPEASSWAMALAGALVIVMGRNSRWRAS